MTTAPPLSSALPGPACGRRVAVVAVAVTVADVAVKRRRRPRRAWTPNSVDPHGVSQRVDPKQSKQSMWCNLCGGGVIYAVHGATYEVQS